MPERSLIKSKIKTLPAAPGCYMFKDKDNKIIYVGKAKVLNRRVNSYFTKIYNYKTTKLVQNIADVDIVVTENEKEALILEQTLIKKYLPRYNILLTDDKRYPYIEITNEADPMYKYVRTVKKNKGLYFGPFPDGTGAREILKLLQRLFPLRRCKGNLGKPCNYFLIHQCSGACFKKVPKEYYEAQIKSVQRFFSGQTDFVIKKLTTEMQQLADNLQFEAANRLKNTINKIKLLTTEQIVEFKDHTSRDFLGYSWFENYFCIFMLLYRQGKLQATHYQLFDNFQSENLSATITSYLQQWYDQNLEPKILYLSSAIDISDLQQIYDFEIITPKKGRLKSILALATENAQRTLHQDLQFKQKKASPINLLANLQQLLNLNHFPDQIDVFDVANLFQDDPVAAVVVYKNGLKQRNLYRKFKLLTSNKSDYHRMQEVIFRRYQKLIKNKDNLPDLIIVDGGKIQINAALLQLKQLNLNIPVIGLVKDKHHRTDHLLTSDGKVINIKSKPQLFYFLAQMQEEVHRFTINFFRNRHHKSLFTSILDDVPGLGVKTRQKLFTHFDSLAQIKAANKEELQAIIHNKNTVANLQNRLKNVNDKNNS